MSRVAWRLLVRNEPHSSGLENRCIPPAERGIGPIKIKAIGQNRFTIQFDVFPEAPPPERSPSKVTLQLVMQNGEWRIGDVDQALQALESTPCTLDQGQR